MDHDSVSYDVALQQRSPGELGPHLVAGDFEDLDAVAGDTPGVKPFGDGRCSINWSRIGLISDEI